MKPAEWLEFQDTMSWSDWLKAHHQDSNGVWLRIKRKHTELNVLDLNETVSTALCYGWIDSQLSTLDKQSYLLHFTPRRPNSVWSMRNRKMAEALLRDGQMHEAGLKAIRIARASGTWDQAYGASEPLEIPVDLSDAFKVHPIAENGFETWSNSDRNQVVYWLNQAKKAETRRSRMSRLIDLLERGLTLRQLK